MSNRDFMVGSIIGGLIGAAAALMLAPKSGREIRDDLGQQASKLKEQTGKISKEELIEKGSEFVNIAKEKSASLSQVVTEQSSQIMDKVKDITKNSGGQQDQTIESIVGDALKEISEDAGQSDSGAGSNNHKESENSEATVTEQTKA
ncbi:YtxH domain-containing protein [Metabacillus malikii]|uniref:Gas vesicle protein n=1 Tax=Metabacillus malikii TaxID=1504265 RepID=A0ABT9ZIL7_9BACI|nr:YtxH domain-containing protein [Metabacillus malikii]MDQ0231080.1 gas vesicle protein [Metabacillus malikii]